MRYQGGKSRIAAVIADYINASGGGIHSLVCFVVVVLLKARLKVLSA